MEEDKTSVTVSKAVRKRLTIKKNNLSFKSINQLLIYLMDKEESR